MTWEEKLQRLRKNVFDGKVYVGHTTARMEFDAPAAEMEKLAEGVVRLAFEVDGLCSITAHGGANMVASVVALKDEQGWRGETKKDLVA